MATHSDLEQDTRAPKHPWLRPGINRITVPMYRSDTSAREARRRPAMLELAILGLLHESSMHGYELRKQLATKLGAFRAAISYGSLYPTLRRLQAAGWITEDATATGSTGEQPLLASKRGRVVYKITAEG